MASLGLRGWEIPRGGAALRTSLGSLGRWVQGMRERTAPVRGPELDEEAELEPDPSPRSTSLPGSRF